MVLALMGIDLDLEVLTDKGRVDGILECKDKVWLIEFKYGNTGTKMQILTDKAIRQIRNKQYAKRFLNDPRPCFLLGIGFVEREGDRVSTRNISTGCKCIACPRKSPVARHCIFARQVIDTSDLSRPARMSRSPSPAGSHRPCPCRSSLAPAC